MFNSSLVASIMNMTAEVYIQQNTQNADTGAISREWVYKKELPCKIEPISSSGAGTKADGKNFSTTQSGNTVYNEGLDLKMKSMDLMSKRWRITNIRSSDGRQVFVEIDKIDQPNTIFEVVSSHAVLDPFGRISYYETTIQRVNVQDNDKTIRN
jgi:hypothetical protein